MIKKSKVHKNGDKRTITKFAYLPIKIIENSVLITVWWQRVTIEQMFERVSGFDNVYEGWTNLRFINLE